MIKKTKTWVRILVGLEVAIKIPGNYEIKSNFYSKVLTQHGQRAATRLSRERSREQRCARHAAVSYSCLCSRAATGCSQPRVCQSADQHVLRVSTLMSSRLRPPTYRPPGPTRPNLFPLTADLCFPPLLSSENPKILHLEEFTPHPVLWIRSLDALAPSALSRNRLQRPTEAERLASRSSCTLILQQH